MLIPVGLEIEVVPFHPQLVVTDDVAITDVTTLPGLLPVLILVLAGVLIAGVWIGVIVHRRRVVAKASTALVRLSGLNSTYASQVVTLPPIHLHFADAVSSKAKFDRYDLTALMLRSVLEQEHSIQAEIGARNAATNHYVEYQREVQQLVVSSLGRSLHPHVSAERFEKIEARLFKRRQMSFPTPTANIRSTVRYTSPQGRNSYSGTLNWDFDELRRGLAAARMERDRQSTAQYLRQRERSLMTPKVRSDILRRDGYRCQMCGATSREGAQLHIDHILPVSHGGTTTPNNLQALCQPCNLGKSNRFVG
ncbi:HNH endonuclease [Leifsonia sp. YIM 134122]|uniref:HNH endonuclease n=1 Tax=Leifsonia stereocauli TaxID=3134136 RepID=A0ABU9W778_9MICO